METTEEENIHNALNKALTEFSEKLKEEYRLHGFKTKEFFEVIDKIMGNFNHSPQDTKLNSGDSSFKSQPEDNNIKGCGKTFKQKSNLSEYTARCGQLICPEVELCPKCQVNNIKGLKVIDGTPTAISNYLSEREKDNNIKGCGGKIC